jgi:hypothetical protein
MGFQNDKITRCNHPPWSGLPYLMDKPGFAGVTENWKLTASLRSQGFEVLCSSISLAKGEGCNAGIFPRPGREPGSRRG